jgi:putative addiction module component (TIGR02574 family)
MDGYAVICYTAWENLVGRLDPQTEMSMSPLAESLLQESLKLPEFDRAELATQLLDSIQDESDNEVPEITDADIARRIQELDDGTVLAISWKEAREKILEVER